MDMAFKVLGAIFSVLIIFVGGLAISISNATETQTNNYFESVSKTIVESNYNESVIEQLIEDAAEDGHELTVQVYERGKAGEKKYADIRLEYTYNVNLFNVSIERVKQKVL